MKTVNEYASLRVSGRSLGLSVGLRVFGLGTLLVGLMGGCASPTKYDEALAQAKYYQGQAFDWETYAHQLETEAEDMRSQLALGQVAGVREGSYDEGIEERMNRLQQLLDDLGRPPGDIERFEVEGGYIFMVQDKILFSSGSASLSEEGSQAILSLASEIRSQPFGRIWVRGHTDGDRVVKPATLERFPHGNLQLSAERAVEVASVLTGRGQIAGAGVAVVGFGPHEPIRPNDNADNKRLNRRVEIFVTDPDRE